MGYTLREVKALGIDFDKEVVSDGKALHDVVMKRIAELRALQRQLAQVTQERDEAIGLSNRYEQSANDELREGLIVRLQRHNARLKECLEHIRAEFRSVPSMHGGEHWSITVDGMQRIGKLYRDIEAQQAMQGESNIDKK